MKSYKSVVLAGTALAVSVVLGGCTSTQSKNLIKGYSESSSSVQKSLLETYSRADSEAQEAKLVLAVKQGATIPELRPEELKHTAHAKVIAQLLAYSEAVNAIASGTEGDDIDEQSKALNDALVSLSSNENVDLPDQYKESAGVISAGVDAIARSYLEYYRLKALRGVMKDANATVVESIRLLRNDLPAWEETTAMSLNKQIVEWGIIINTPNRCISETGLEKMGAAERSAVCAKFSQTPNDRLEMYRKLLQLKQQKESLPTAFSALDKPRPAILFPAPIQPSPILELGRINLNTVVRICLLR